MHWALEVKTQPFLNAAHPASLGKVQKQDQVQNDWGSKNTVAAQEINFDLHGVTEQSVDVDVVPSFFIISARRIVMDPHFMRELLVEIREKLWLQNIIDTSQLTCFLR